MEFILFVIYLSIYVGLVATTFYILSFLSDRKKTKEFLSDDELPFVSIIIPAYNEENSIAKTIEDILKSNYPSERFEILVVDDGSKDKTFEIAKKYESEKIKVFHKENGGKGSALNLGIKKAKGEIILTLDADTFASPESMKNMIRYFKNEKVVSVTPAMVLDKPKTILQRVQQIEYLMGLFLRKAFASLDAIYIAPGAFSAYRKSFFEKYGGYEEGNITEDLELALRIQSKGYITENCPDAPVYTVAPSKFKPLMIQRRRWYYGLIKNTWNYRHILGRKYGDLGVFVLPIAGISILLSVFVTVYFFFKTLFNVYSEILFLRSVNFYFGNVLNFNFYVVERFLFLFFSNPIIIFVLIFMIVMFFYLHYASKKVGRSSGLVINILLFFFLFALLFGFWWVVSIFYAIFYKKIRWR
ncbi:MAG: glycosyltransferase [Candidatus Pacearchaeota archaeon]